MESQPEFLWEAWKRNKTKGSSMAMLESFRPMIRKEVNKHSGQLPQSFLEVEAKRLVFDAFDTFDAGRGNRLSTHVGNRLKGLGRVNYTYQNALRMPEDRQRRYTGFIAVKRELEERLGREPSTQELSEKLVWPIREVGRMESEVHRENPEPAANAGLQSGIAPALFQPGRNVPVVDFLYHDMTPDEQVIFEGMTGHNGRPLVGVAGLARKLNLSEPQVRRLRDKLVNKIEKQLR